MKDQIQEVIDLLQASRRPVFIWGAGMRAYAKEAYALAHSLGIPVACTWGAIDLIRNDDPLFAGGFGTHGSRASNFAVQNSDLIVSIGSRLDTKATGHVPDFARAARIVMCDLDQAEISKFDQLGRKIDIGICADAGEFIERLRNAIALWSKRPAWVRQVQDWREIYDTPTVTWPGVNPYELMKEIAKWTTSDDIIVSDTGTVLGYIMQGFPFKGERFLHAFNMTPMGYGLPAAVGASFASGRRVVLVSGDGSLMMSLPELATIARWDLNIKIILLNNHGHAMCRQTQRQWLSGNYHSTSVEGGLGFPDWDKIDEAFNIGWAFDLQSLFVGNGPAFLPIEVHPDAHLIPQARFGQPIHDQDPPLDREELKQQMIAFS